MATDPVPNEVALAVPLVTPVTPLVDTLRLGPVRAGFAAELEVSVQPRGGGGRCGPEPQGPRRRADPADRAGVSHRRCGPGRSPLPGVGVVHVPFPLFMRRSFGVSWQAHRGRFAYRSQKSWCYRNDSSSREQGRLVDRDVRFVVASCPLPAGPVGWLAVGAV